MCGLAQEGNRAASHECSSRCNVLFPLRPLLAGAGENAEFAGVNSMTVSPDGKRFMIIVFVRRLAYAAGKVQASLRTPAALRAARSQAYRIAGKIHSGECYYSVMNRKHTVIRRMSDRHNDDFVPGSPSERIAFVWPLTREAVSLNKGQDAQRRLQRHVASLSRREG